MANGNAKLIAESAPPQKGRENTGFPVNPAARKGTRSAIPANSPGGNPDSPPRKKARRENEACLLAAGV